MKNETKPTTEADRFRAFAKQIVSVPKAVIDRREKEWKARQAAKKAARLARS